ncbi:MAG: hypothetical protein OER92_05370 [Alphaproteobacteria bacterium]|nr:hypothetical protein [Alphaproteobacteria bacterium]
MFKALIGSVAVFVILVFAVVAPSGVLKAQEAGQTPVAEPAPVAVEPAAEPAPEGAELTDEEIRQILTEDSLKRFKSWRMRRGFRNSTECSDYDGVKRPTRPDYVFCDPADVPAEQIELYRETKRQENTTFVNEPAIKF